MKNLLTFVLLALFVASCGTRTRELTVMTYNVGALDKYGPSAGSVAKIINEVGADVVSLNELDSCNGRHKSYQAKELADSLGEGWNYIYARTIAFMGGAYGIGQVTQDEVMDSYVIGYGECNGNEERKCLVVETADYVLACTHLDYQVEAIRLGQLKIAADSLAARYGNSSKPVFLCGDFNDTPESNTLAAVKDNWHVISSTAPTYPSDKAQSCIDYILLLNNKAKVEVVASEVITSSPSCSVEEASDHLPVYAKVVIISGQK